ncbi:MAG: DUF4339 domain-containing protein [bacterium]|nr:DUF4339 domain-containing protein [bacterium]
MIIVCSRCGQYLNGTVDMLSKEVQCPACMECARPHLPKADRTSQPESTGQSSLNDLIEANKDVEDWHNRRRERQPAQRPPRPAQAVQPRPTAPVQPEQSKLNHWYIVTDSVPRGPFNNKQIVQFAKEGKINKANLMINAHTKATIRAGMIPNLFTRKTPQKQPQGQWYVQTAKGNAGPFPSEKIVEFAKSGKIKADTMLRHGTTGKLTAAGTVSGLIPAAS